MPAVLKVGGPVLPTAAVGAVSVTPPESVGGWAVMPPDATGGGPMMLTTDAVGGVWRYSLELASQFAALGAPVLLVVMGPAPNDSQRAEAACIPGLRLMETGLPLDWLATEPADLRAAAHDLARLAADERVCSVHLHTPALVADAPWRMPVVAVAHSCVATWWRAVQGGALPADLAWRATATAQGLASADAVIAPSQSFAAALTAQYGLRRAIDVVWNGRRPSGVSAPQAGHVFTAGRLWDAGKNAALIDAAAARLDAPVFAAGPLVGPHGVSITFQHLRCLGSLDEAAMAAQFAAASVFVSMARYEPFGLAVLEAAQAGCALVLSDIPTFRELWDGAALFVAADDELGLAAALRDCVQSQELRARLGGLAQRRAVQFSPEAMAAATWHIHGRLLQAAETSRRTPYCSQEPLPEVA